MKIIFEDGENVDMQVTSANYIPVGLHRCQTWYEYGIDFIS